MTKFYHELRVNKKPPIQALREAQLAIYRRPDLIPDLAAVRGLKLEPAQPLPAGSKTAPTQLWAGFVVSGVGK
jgi:CHAT domain-containing protein